MLHQTTEKANYRVDGKRFDALFLGVVRFYFRPPPKKKKIFQYTKTDPNFDQLSIYTTTTNTNKNINPC